MLIVTRRASGIPAAWLARALCAALALSLTGGAALAGAPPIRTSPSNAVPACVTPQRLMAFIKSRNSDIDPRFADIARLYKSYGETWRVRWLRVLPDGGRDQLPLLQARGRKLG